MRYITYVTYLASHASQHITSLDTDAARSWQTLCIYISCKTNNVDFDLSDGGITYF